MQFADETACATNHGGAGFSLPTPACGRIESGALETYGAMGAGTDGYAVVARQADRPRARQQFGKPADARPIGAAVEGFAAPRPGMVVELAANAGGGRRRIPGTGAVAVQLRAAGCDLVELGLVARPQPAGAHDRTGAAHLRTAPERRSRGGGAGRGRCTTRDAISDRGDAGHGCLPRAYLFRHPAPVVQRRVPGQGGFGCGMTCCSTTNES